MVVIEIFITNPQNVSWGQNTKNERKRASGSHLRGPMSTLITEQTTDTIFEPKKEELYEIF